MGGCCEVLRSPNFPVALLLFLTTCAGMGTSKALGIYLQDISGHIIGTPSTDLRIALGLFNVFAYIPAPLVAALYRQRPLRRVLLICGSCLVSIGFMLTSFATNKAPIGIFLSVCGLGNCFLLTSASIALNDLASEHFNLIYSISMSGFGVGTVVLPLLTEYLRQSYGWRGGILIVGALLANIIPCAVAVRFGTTSNGTPTDHCSSKDEDVSERHSCDTPSGSNTARYRGEHRSEDETDSDSDAIYSSTQRESFPLMNSHSELLTDLSEENSELSNGFFSRLLTTFRASDFYIDPAFNFFFLAMILVSLGYCGWHALIVPHALEKGLTVQDILLLTLSTAVGSMSGRVLVGLLCDNRFSPVTIYLLSTLLDIASLLFDVFLSTLYVSIVTSYIRAGTLGGRAILGTLAARERASAGKKDIVFALGLFCIGIGTLLGTSFLGVIAHISSPYDVTWWLVAGICLEIVVFLIVLVPLIFKKR